MRHTFFGGVNPATLKESTRRKPIARLEYPPERVYLPLSTHTGDNAIPAVKPGDQVAVGQPIAVEHNSTVFAHASISGRVSDIREHPHPWGGSALTIVIENDGQDTLWPDRPQPLDSTQVTLDLLLARVREAGIVGMGGGAYPTAEKLQQSAGKVDTLIINAAECEPYVTADYRLLLERSDKILLGAQTIARAIGAQRAVLVTEGDKLNAAEAVERRLRKRSGKVELCTVRTRYPLGAEKQIVQTVTGREIPPGGGPLNVKCVVLNVATVFAIQDALFRGKALTHRAVTVTGGAVARPRNLWVPIGTPLTTLLESTGGLREKPQLILTGGPMMGTPQHHLEAPVLKSTNALVCLTSTERRRQSAETVCIRCGKCVASCPMHLAPSFICRALRQNELYRLPKLHPEDCIECGCCSYICPARIPLLELVRQSRDLLAKGGVG
ncbi:MAG: electron transport complex subunit RsxC [Lawsonibacter sp.]